MRIAFVCLTLSTLIGCAEEGALDVPLDEELAPPAPLELAVSQLYAGGAAKMTARSTTPGSQVHFVMSRRGRGTTCPPQLGGGCVDLAGPLTYLGAAPANRAGFAELTFTVPRAVPDSVDVFVQAVIVNAAGGLRKSAVVDQMTGGMMCPLYYSPVCGIDGVTYGNDCDLGTAGTFLDHAGPC